MKVKELIRQLQLYGTDEMEIIIEGGDEFTSGIAVDSIVVCQPNEDGYINAWYDISRQEEDDIFASVLLIRAN